METCKRILAVLLCVVLTLTAAPLSGFVGLDLSSLFGFKADATMHVGFGTLDCEVRGDLLIAAGEGDIPDCASPSDVWWSDSTSDIESAIIGNGVTGIGSYVCYGFENMTSLTLCDSVVRIGDYAFAGCNQLAEIYYTGTQEQWNEIEIGIGNDALNSAVIHYGEAPIITDVCGFGAVWALDIVSGNLTVSGNGSVYYPWEGRPASDWKDYALLVKSIAIDSGITNIPYYGFYGFENLKSVTISSDVLNIEESAFEFCNSIENVYYSGTEEYWNNIFIGDGNEALTSANITFNFPVLHISVASGACGDNLTWRLDLNGILTISGTGEMYNYNRTPWCKGEVFNDRVLAVVVEDGVTSIGMSTFADCTNLEIIMLPKSITSISDYAFNNCTDLKYVHYTGSLSKWNSIQIGDNGNEALDRVYISCHGLDYSEVPTTLPVEVPTTAPSVEETTTSPAPTTTRPAVTTTLPPATTKPVITTLPPTTTKPIVTEPSVVETTTKAPATEETTTVPTPSYDYSGMCGDNLTWSLDTSTGVLNVTGTGAMTNYSFSSSTPWYSYRSNIKTVNIASGVTSIGYYAFYSCGSLTSVTIPDSVTTIGYDAFYDCDSLTSVIIPDSVTTIDDDAFNHCDSLTSIIVDENNKNYSSDSYGVLFNKDKTELIQYPIGNARTSYTIPDSVTTIGNYAFDSCSSLTSVTIPDSVTTIGDYAFSSCDSLTSVTIPDSVITIGYAAFDNCDSLTSVTIPGGVTTIGNYAFYLCGSLTSVTIGNSVTTIGDSAFEFCDSLTNVTIGDSVTTIGDYAFSDCDSLTNVTIPDSVTTIGDMAFAFCYDLTSITIPDSVTTIGDSAFALCYGLTSIVIPDSVTSVGCSPFAGCEKLESISVDPLSEHYCNDEFGVLYTKDFSRLVCFPNGSDLKEYTVPATVSVIGDSAFSASGQTDRRGFISHGSNVKLEKIIIPDSVTTIGDMAFSACDSLKSVTIPNSVTTIGEHAFYSCDSLTSVTIGNSVTTIGEFAFYGCDSLTDVYYTGTEVQWNKISIYSHNEDLTFATIHYNFSGFGNVVSENIDYYIKYDDHDYRRVTINATIADSSFSQDSAVYNHDLARLCSQFTVVGYTSGDGNGNGKNTVMKKALKELGFENPVVNLSEERTSVNHFITHKKITVNGEEYTLIFMGFIGSYHEQWYSNFDPGEGATHQGFKGAATSMKLVLMDYIKDMNLDKSKTKFLITGHSRGAATANLFAADLIKNEQFALKENIYTYAFATPNSTSSPERNNAEYKRIFNIVNPEDFVTKVMPVTWKYGRYGTTYVLPSRTNTSNYSAYYSNMNPVFRVLTNGENYAPYKNGEEEVYKLVKKFTSTVKSPYDFYNKKMSYLPFNDITPWEFFQIAVCPLVGEKAGVNSKFLSGLSQFVSCLLYPGACETYNQFCEFFLTNAVLDKVNTMTPEVAKAAITIMRPLLGASINTILATSEGYFEDSHCAETYCAYMMSMSESQVKQTRKAYKNTVNCPVDVEVIDNETGEVVGRIVNNVVDEEIAAKENAIVMSVDGDSKSFWLPSDGDYEVKLIGNDEGTMDYTVAEIDPDLGEQERVNFFDVEITEGKEFTGDVPAYDFELEEYTLKTDSGEEVPDQKLDAESGEITITTSVEGDGYITNTLTVKSGDYVTLNAQPVVTAEFVKWVDSSGNTLSTDAEYSFVAKENTSIKAVFTTASGLSIKTPSTTTVNYGDTLILHADFGEVTLPEGYTILWTVEGAGFDMAPAADGLTCKMTSVANGNATIKATLVDENGEAVLDAEGNEMSDTQELKSNAGFWQKIVSFFKNLFRISRIILQSIDN